MEIKKTHIANFNCTFGIAGKAYPMLSYFDSLILPAVTNNLFVRKVTGGGEFYFAEVEVVDLSDEKEKPDLALVGKLVKRVELEIRNDYSMKSGFIPVGERHPSAPFSTFILLLRNHRLIFWGDQKGSPSVRSLASTFQYAIKKYKKRTIDDTVKGYNENGYSPNTPLLGEVSKDRFPLKKDLMRHLVYSLPVPEIDVIPIPHPNIVEEKIKEFSKIEKLSFKIFALNSELQINDTLRRYSEMSNRMGTEKAGGYFDNPRDFDKVTDFVKESKGLADINVKAKIGNNKISMSTDDFTESIPVEVPVRNNLPFQSRKVYNELRNREELQVTSSENMGYYQRYLSK